MKKTNRTLLLAATFTLFAFVTACKKDNTQAPPNDPPVTQQPQSLKWPRVKVTDIDKPYAKFYIYDDSGRIATQYTAYDTMRYKYAGNTINATYYRAGISRENESYITQDGLVYQRSETASPGRHFIYVYTPSKMRQKMVDTFETGGINRRYVYFSTGANTDSVKIYNSTNHLELLMKYEYYMDKKNTISHEAFGRPFNGIDNENPVKRETVFVQGTYISGYTDYNYEYDSLGRITRSVNWSNGNQSTSFATSYTYY